jgi:CheY-like chemotaxis protein
MAHILIAEDEEILADLITKELQEAGHTTVTTVNGQVAWQKLQEEAFDLVISDLLMPEKSGYDLLSDIRADERFEHLPCLVLSNSGQIDDLNRAYAVGATDVLIKTNFNPDQLTGKVAQLLQPKNQPGNEANAA